MHKVWNERKLHQQSEVTTSWSSDNIKGNLQIRIICDRLAVCFGRQRSVCLWSACLLGDVQFYYKAIAARLKLFSCLLRNREIRCFTPRPSSMNKSTGNTSYRSAVHILAFCSQHLAHAMEYNTAFKDCCNWDRKRVLIFREPSSTPKQCLLERGSKHWAYKSEGTKRGGCIKQTKKPQESV